VDGLSGAELALAEAVVDHLVRDPDGTGPYRGPAVHKVSGDLRVSLRVEVSDDLDDFAAVLQVHSGGLVTDAAALWTGTDRLGDEHLRAEAMLAVRRTAELWPPLRRLLDQAVPDRLELTDEEVSDLLTNTALTVHWPKELSRDLTAAAAIGTRSEAPPAFGTEGLLEFNWQLALGDQPLTEAEMDRLAEAHRPVVRLRDRWTLVGSDLIGKARDRAMKPLSAIDALGAALTGTADVDGALVPVAPTETLAELRERLRVDEEIPQPAALAATLRDYQLRGLRWLARMTDLGLGGCLADDMGLGKTITLIALHLHRGRGPTLVVCPASLLGNWEREIRRFAPGVPVHRYHGADRSIPDSAGFVLTTYGTMRMDAADLADHHWDLLVADEAQHVKNPRSDTARALRLIPSAARVALTGTPVENALSELWAILDWTTPGLLGTLDEFRSRWARSIEDGDPARAEALSRLVQPFLLRRTKSDPGIAPELPSKTETDQPVALTAEQAGLYEAVVRETMADIRAATGIQRRGLVLKLLTALKQVCNHPAHYLGETGPLAGRSGKLELLDELVDTIRAEGGGLLVFTQYVAMARLLERHLGDRGVPTQLLHGGTPVRRRDELVARFQASTGTDTPVFLLSLKAAGTGLNLTRADHVVHYDRWWNPAVEAQATDRAYRIGQDRPVQVHRLIAEGTIEDRIAAMLVAKKELAESVLGQPDTDLTELTELTDAQLADLVALRRHS
jgi:superfamily II DNA or RNA helicase